MALALQKEEQDSGVWVMKIYLATWLRDYTNGPSLNAVNQSKRLLSYFLYMEEAIDGEYPKNALRIYIRTGEFESRKSRR